MVSKTNLQANCNCTKTVAKLNQKLLGKFDRKNLNSISYEPLILKSLFYQQFNSVLANQKKTINDSFQRNDQTLEFNPTNLNIIGTKLTNGSDLKYMQFTLILDQKSKRKLLSIF
jgi:hypothetical protein